jgi:RecB family exonuclease
VTVTADTELQIAAVTRVSPSRYAYLRSCALYEACRSAGQKPLLPTSPLSQIGGIAHRLLERAAKGEFAQSSMVEPAWHEMVEGAEARMNASPLDSRFVPLRKNVRQYEVLRIQACRKAEWISTNVAAVSGFVATGTGHSRQFEVWLQSSDGMVGGYVDCLEETPEGAIIRDYKTGAILETAEAESQPRIKSAYAVQLHLYAALYWSSRGRWPNRLELIPLLGPAVVVPFEPNDCLELLDQAKQRLRTINSRIRTILTRHGSIAELAMPSDEACRFCEFRPGCKAYWDHRAGIDATEWPIDLRGRVVRQKTFAAGTTTIEISNVDDTVRYRITGLRATRYPELRTNQEGAFVSAYNLRRQMAPATFSDSALSAVYFAFDLPAAYHRSAPVHA